MAVQGKKVGFMDRKVDRLTGELQSARAELKNLAALVADLLRGEEQRREMSDDLQQLKEQATKLQEDLNKQQDTMMALATTISGFLPWTADSSRPGSTHL